jgi:hypothetical protein
MASGFNRKIPHANKPLTAITIAAVVDNYVPKKNLEIKINIQLAIWYVQKKIII